MIDTREQKVLELIDANQQEVIDFLRENPPALDLGAPEE